MIQLAKLSSIANSKIIYIALAAFLLPALLRRISSMINSFFSQTKISEYDKQNPVRAAFIQMHLATMQDKESGWFNTGFSVQLSLPYYKILAGLTDNELRYATHFWYVNHAQKKGISGRSFKQQAARGKSLSTKKPFAGILVDRLEKLGL